MEVWKYLGTCARTQKSGVEVHHEASETLHTNTASKASSASWKNREEAVHWNKEKTDKISAREEPSTFN